MFLVPLGKTTHSKTLSFGGKADALSRLMNAGFPVPRGFAIAAEAFHEGAILHEAQVELFACVGTLSKRITYAVRSSAVGEDGQKASFAGMYDTILDVARDEIPDAVLRVAASTGSDRMNSYAKSKETSAGAVGVIIQEYIPADFAGVLFTSDVISGSSARMVGNYVMDAGEKLVSGEANAKSFTMDVLKYAYSGESAFAPHAKILYRYAVKIKRLFAAPQDIEWVISGTKTYILQSRPITTLQARDEATYQINDSLAGEFLFSKTNVGEIFMRPLSPVTHSILDAVFEMLGIPLIANIGGQAYCNVSAMCSILVSFGFSKQKAYSMISDIAGRLPDDVDIPIYPYEKRFLFKKVRSLLFAPKKKADFGVRGKAFTRQIATIADRLIEKIRLIDSKEELYVFWFETCDVFMTKVLTSIIGGLSLKPLLHTREKLKAIAGERLANELCSNCSQNGTLESLKPLLLIEDVIAGKISKKEYSHRYGHRHTNEMELSCPYPYEDPFFPDDLIEEYLRSDFRASEMKTAQEARFQEAVKEFKKTYPAKAKWLDKTLREFASATSFREDVRSQSVKLFCLLREFLLKADKLLSLGDDVFLLHFQEVMAALKGDISAFACIPKRKKNYEKALNMPPFPNVIVGRFDPETWIKDVNRRADFYQFGKNSAPDRNAAVTGYAGASGRVEGVARVLTDISQADELQSGEILVTTATNIGWVKIFPKVSAIVTDIGAPLSHAAIVARELGIPAVVGCGNATTVIRTGDRIVVDGTGGFVSRNPVTD